MADSENIVSSLSESLDLTRELQKSTETLGRTIASVFSQGVVQGRRFDDMMRSVGQRMVSFALRLAMKPVENALQSFLSGLVPAGLGLGGAGAPLNILPSANGNSFRLGAVTPFAHGGVIAAPTYFPMRGGLGLMGERGAEAVMPLARGADGKLGVRGAGGAPTSVTVNIATPDVEGFRRSEAQIAAALARAVGRGRRSM